MTEFVIDLAKALGALGAVVVLAIALRGVDRARRERARAKRVREWYRQPAKGLPKNRLR